MTATLKWNDGATTTEANALTLVVDAAGLWRESATAARHLDSLDASMDPTEALALTLVRASSAVPNLRYVLDGSGWTGTALSGGNYLLTVPTPLVPTTHKVTAVPATPAAPANLTITVRRQSLALRSPGAPIELREPAE